MAHRGRGIRAPTPRVAVEGMEHTREYRVPGLINSKTEEKVE